MFSPTTSSKAEINSVLHQQCFEPTALYSLTPALVEQFINLGTSANYCLPFSYLLKVDSK